MADKPILEKNFNEDLDVEKRLKEGGILARFFIEVQGNDKKVAKDALVRTVFDSLASEQAVSLINAKLFDLKKYKREEKEDNNKSSEETFSGVAEVKAIFRDFHWFISTLMRYGPSATEIIEPESYILDMEEMQALVSDVSSFSQTFSSQVLTMLKDSERKALYQKALSKGPVEQ